RQSCDLSALRCESQAGWNIFLRCDANPKPDGIFGKDEGTWLTAQARSDSADQVIWVHRMLGGDHFDGERPRCQRNYDARRCCPKSRFCVGRERCGALSKAGGERATAERFIRKCNRRITPPHLASDG